MKKLMTTILTGLALVAIAGPALAMGPLDVDASLGVHGKYVWRGMVVTPDPVLQPQVDLGVAGLTAGFWGNMDTNDVNGDKGKFKEIDWSLGYELGLPKIGLGAGFIVYTFPSSDAPSTTELYVSASLSVPLSPTLTVYQDIDEIKGAYWEAGVSHAVPLNPTTNLDLAATLGLGSKSYTAGYFGADTLLPAVPEVPGNASMTDFAVTASVPFNVALFFTVTPAVSYSTLLGDVKDIVDAAGDMSVYHGDTDAFNWSLTASFSF